MKTNYISAKSPKNKYYAEVYFKKALPGLGSVCSTGAMDLDSLNHRIKFYTNQGKVESIIIRENLEQYPKFNWKKL